jgi:hypothetical protein
MICKLKLLSVGVFAVFVLVAATASPASAASYTASSYPTKAVGISPLGNGTFTTEAGKVECVTHYESHSLVASSSGWIVTTFFTECRAFGFLSATVNMGSCSFQLLTPSGSGDSYSAAVKILCSEAANPITVTASTCKMTIGEQSPTGSVAITNNTPEGDLSIKANVTGIKYTVTQDGIGCAFSGTGAKSGATAVHDNAITFDSTNGATIDVG